MSDKKRGIIENAQYIVLALIMLGQAVCVMDMMWGQIVFFAANAIGIYRVIVLDFPTADKVKNVACMVLTIGIMIALVV